LNGNGQGSELRSEKTPKHAALGAIYNQQHKATKLTEMDIVASKNKH